MNWQDFISFRKMITPALLKIIFWIEVAVVIIGGIVLFFVWLVSGVSNGSVGEILLAIFGVPIGVILGLLLVRVGIELQIVLFSIHDTLTDIKNLLAQK